MELYRNKQNREGIPMKPLYKLESRLFYLLASGNTLRDKRRFYATIRALEGFNFRGFERRYLTGILERNGQPITTEIKQRITRYLKEVRSYHAGRKKVYAISG